MYLFKVILLSFFTSYAMATVAGDNIIISEVQYDPLMPDHANEWFELFNPTPNTINISGWQFTDGEGTATFPPGTVIASGVYFIATHTDVAGNLGAFPAVPVDFTYGAVDVGNIFFSNGGDELTLLDNTATVVDFVSWEGHTPGWGGVSANDSESIMRNSSTDTDVEGDWLSNQAPTPGTGTLTVFASSTTTTPNLPPKANNDRASAPLGTEVTFSITANDRKIRRNTVDLDASSVGGSGVDTDGDGDIDQVTVAGQGTWSVDSRGVLTFRPIAGFKNHPTPIKYRVKGNTGATLGAIVTIRYTTKLDAVDDGMLTIEQRGTIDFTSIILDNDAYIGTIEISIVRDANFGTVELVYDENGQAQILYTSLLDYNNIKDSFEYLIIDDQGEQDRAVVRLDIQCASSQRSDNGDALNSMMILLLMFLTIIIGYESIKNEQGEDV